MKLENQRAISKIKLLQCKVIYFLKKINFPRMFKLIIRCGWVANFIAICSLWYTVKSGVDNETIQSHFHAQLILNQNPDNGINKREAVEILVRDNISLEGIRLTDAYLPGVNMRGAYADNADFSGAILKRANLSYSSFSGANFTGAHLNGAALIAFNNRNVRKGTQMVPVRLDPNRGYTQYTGEDNPQQVIIEDARYSTAVFRKANLSMAKLVDANLSFAALDGADLSGALLYRASLYASELTGANLQGADISDAAFVGENGRNAANVSQEQINSACIVTGHPPKLPQNLKAPTTICHHKWSEGEPPER